MCVETDSRACNRFPGREALFWQECGELLLDIRAPGLGSPLTAPHAAARFLMKSTVYAVCASQCLLPEDLSVFLTNVSP